MGMWGRLWTGCAVVAVASAAPNAAAEVVFFDDFESYGSNSVLNWTPPAGSPWTVTDGTVDLIEDPNQWGLDASNGAGLLDGGDFFLDLDGSTSNPGLLMSIDLGALSSVTAGGPGPFTNLVAGRTYQLEFIMSGNQRSGSDVAEIGVMLGGNAGTTVLLTESLASTDPWTLYTALFTYAAGDRIYFQNNGNNNIGVLLDNVRLSVVPVPPAAALGLLGFGLVGLMRRNAAKRAQTTA